MTAQAAEQVLEKLELIICIFNSSFSKYWGYCYRLDMKVCLSTLYNFLMMKCDVELRAACCGKGHASDLELD
jgi:hypothetical protein